MKLKIHHVLEYKITINIKVVSACQIYSLNKYKWKQCNKWTRNSVTNGHVTLNILYSSHVRFIPTHVSSKRRAKQFNWYVFNRCVRCYWWQTEFGVLRGKFINIITKYLHQICDARSQREHSSMTYNLLGNMIALPRVGFYYRKYPT